MTTMTKQQKLDTLEAVEARAFAELADADPKAVEFNNILNNVGLLRSITEMIRFSDPTLFTVPESEGTCAPALTLVKPAEYPSSAADAAPSPQGEGLKEADTAPQEDTAPWEDKPEEAQLTYDEVRSRMITYARGGLDPAPLLQQLGCTKLSDVPQAKYRELLALAEAAVQEGA